MIDAHVHIERGPYTFEWIDSFISYAKERGITELHLLEHSHRFLEFRDVYKSVEKYNDYQRDWLNRKMELSISEYIKFIEVVRKREFPISIKFGLEVCYFEDAENMIRDIIEAYNWDFVTGSVHWIDGWGFDHDSEFWDQKDVDFQYRRYYEIMTNLIKSKLFDIVAHPDSIKCFGHYPSFDLADTYIRLAGLLNQYGVCVEQSAGLYMNYNFHEMGMNEKMYNIFKNRMVKLITASDAHRPEDVGKYIRELNLMNENK